MDLPLIASACLLGLVGAPHCTVMCSAPCAAAIGGAGVQRSAAFHVARIAGYAAGGAVAASSMALLGHWSQISPALRPLWNLLNAAGLMLGLWLLWQGRQPVWLARGAPRAPAGWQGVKGPLRGAAAGALWVAWPCGLLQSALLVAAMTNGPLPGAAAMAGFAAASAPGLVLGPWAWRKLLRGPDAAARERWALRGAGALLVAATTWALGHGLWPAVAAFCGLA